MGRTPPIPGDLFAGVFRRYERAKERAGRIDFEDMLHRMLEGFERRDDVAEEFRGQYRWFSVDEYQDTNPLQQALLEAWLGSGATWPWSGTRTRRSTPSPGRPPST